MTVRSNVNLFGEEIAGSNNLLNFVNNGHVLFFKYIV